MNEIKFHGAQKRIDFLNRWSMAFLAIFVVLAGWLGNSIMAEEFGKMFRFGVVIAIVVGILCIVFAWAAHQRIKQLEEHQDD